MESSETEVIDAIFAPLHFHASQYAVAVDAAVSVQLNGKHPFPLAGGAIYRLGADTVAFHEAVLALCATGWVACSAPLLRTLLDLLLSTAIIVERTDESEMRGFRFTHYWLKAMLAEGDDEAKQGRRRQIEAGIARIAELDQERARRFIFNDRLPAYWYAPDFYRRPQEAAKALLSPELSLTYGKVSSAAHGGFFGLSVFRDQPDIVHPNQRRDLRSQALALSMSIRIILEQTRLRDLFELGGQFSSTYDKLIVRLIKTDREWQTLRSE